MVVACYRQVVAGKGGKGGKGGKVGKSKRAPQSRSAKASLQVSFFP